MADATEEKTFPVVLRFQGMYPHHLGGYEAHRMRKGGDLSHVDRDRSDLNKPLIGKADWAVTALAEIEEMAQENFAAELESLEQRNRRKDIKRRLAQGPKAPWRPTRHGPLREVILTANSEWFDDDVSSFLGEKGNRREKEFEKRAVDWLKHHFGADVIHARADRDELAYHIHAVIMPRATVVMDKPNAKVPVASATRRMLQPSVHPMIEDYEAAQDDVGVWFSGIGLTRGEKRAEAIRQARANGVEAPKRRYHARTQVWRAEQEQKLVAEDAALKKRSRAVEVREDEAEAVLAVADGIAHGAIELDVSGDEPKLSDASLDPRPEEAALRDRMARSPTGVARAVGVFGALWRRLSKRSKALAEREADARVAVDVQEIRAADDAIVEIAQALPDSDRRVIANKRRGLISKLLRLERSVDRRERPEKGEGGAEGKLFSPKTMD